MVSAERQITRFQHRVTGGPVFPFSQCHGELRFKDPLIATAARVIDCLTSAD